MAIINPASINSYNHHHQASLHHQPTHQSPKTTNQNPLIKIIKTHWSKSLNSLIKTIKQRKNIAMAIGERSNNEKSIRGEIKKISLFPFLIFALRAMLSLFFFGTEKSNSLWNWIALPNCLYLILLVCEFFLLCIVNDLYFFNVLCKCM